MKKAEYSKKTIEILEHFKTKMPLEITKEEAIDSLIKLLNALPEENTVNYFLALDMAINTLRERPQGEWIPIKTRPLTDEERKSISQYYGFNYDASNDYAFHCPMPEEGQEILISTPWGVSKDRCEYDCTDDGMSLFSLEDRGDWEDVKAWMPLPEPYKDGGDKND